MIDKKKLKDVMKKQDLKQEKPTDPSMTLDVKNEDVEAQIDLYLKEKTGENLNALIELMRTRRVLVPANLNDEKKPVPCLINSPKNGMFLPIYTSKKEIPESPRSEAVINMPFLATNNMVFQQDEKVSGIVINPFTQNLIFKRALVEKIEEVEKKRKEGAQPKKMQLTQEQYLLFERKQFEFGFMPKRFFAQGKQMMDDLCEKKEEYMDQFFEECYQQKRMYPYLPEDFSVMVMDLCGRYEDSAECAEEGRKACLKYGHYQYLPHCLEIQAECAHFMGDDKKSADLYRKCYYLCQVIEYQEGLEITKKEAKEYLGMEFET